MNESKIKQKSDIFKNKIGFKHAFIVALYTLLIICSLDYQDGLFEWKPPFKAWTL